MKKLVLIAALASPFFAFSQEYYKTLVYGDGGIENVISGHVSSKSELITTGLFQTDLNFDGEILKHRGGNADGYLAKYDEDGNPIWARAFGGWADDAVLAVTTDPAGNHYVTGYFQGATNGANRAFDADPGPDSTFLNQRGSFLTRDMFIVKLDSDGDFVWGKQVSNTEYPVNEDVKDIAVDSDGNVLLVGRFAQADFDTDPEKDSIFFTVSGKYEGFVLCLNNDGDFKWANHYYGGENSVEEIILDDQDQIYIAGNFNKAMNFNDSIGLTSTQINSYVAKLDKNGKYINHYSFGGNSRVYSETLELIGDKVVLGGRNSGPIMFTTDSADISTHAGSFDFYLATFSTDLDFITGRSFGAKSLDEITDVIQDQNGNLLVAANFYDTINVDGHVLASKGKYDMALISMDNNLQVLNTLTIGGEEDVKGSKIFQNSKGQLVTTGSFRGVVDFDPSTNEDLQASFGQYDFFISHFNWEVLTGIFEKENDVNIMLFPNPAANYIVVNGIKDAELRIYSMTGQLVSTGNSEQRMDISALRVGQYIVVAENEKEHAHKVFIKQ